ncbi:protein BatD [Caldichromatium japonicum]|uniref:Protein BatD n=1 Tax=Caldichromatium japonicum TaxID=2699430 RepID=A0A6G7VBT3_9GAMM|nr:BatD family protein [Caldichromatium japonicum]QIK37519.1 protein BatD [Caldichromatium japonicum]
MAPGWQGPASPPSGPRPQAPGPFQAPSAWTPRLNWSIETSDPYLQQPVLLRLEVASSDDPGTLSLELPTTDDALLKVFSGPTNDIRFEQGVQQIIKRFILTLTPVRTGDLALPPIRVKGTLGFGQVYELATDPIRLQVRPPMPSVRPWLPLKSLILKAHLDREGPLAPGQPVTLVIELAATGGTATQLPSLEKQLAASGLRVYREQALTDTRLSADGQALLAGRTEYYTLIPQNSGRLTLPELSIAWWNLERAVREVARLSPLTLEVRGGPLQQTLAWLADIAARLWLPLVVILLVLGSYWVGTRYRGRLPELGRDVIRLTLTVAAGGWRQLSAWGAPLTRTLAPGSVFRRLHRFGLRLLPEQRRLILKLRHAEGAKTPEDWYRRLMQTDLVDPGALTRPGLLGRLVNACPKANPQTLARLLRQLDAAIYGREPLDFAQWKRDWHRQLRRGCKPLARTGRWLQRAGLPPLNPQV